MAEQHTVKKGDTMISIAAEKNFASWEAIWGHPSNARLREQRKDPQVLAEGDVVNIPDPKERAYPIETNKVHTFTVKTLKAWFRIVARDDKGAPLANCRFQLDVGGKLRGGYTDASGVIELQIDPKAKEGKLTVHVSDDPKDSYTWNVKLGHLDPIDKVSGVKARLTNLGFVCGEINDQEDDKYKDAVRNFQIVYRLPLTGEVDDAMRSMLLALHDKRQGI